MRQFFFDQLQKQVLLDKFIKAQKTARLAALSSKSLSTAKAIQDPVQAQMNLYCNINRALESSVFPKLGLTGMRPMVATPRRAFAKSGTAGADSKDKLHDSILKNTSESRQ